MRVVYSFAAYMAGLLASVTPAMGQLSKPVMNPAVPFSDMDTFLYKYLPSTPHTLEQWSWGWLPARCKAVADQNGLSPYDIDVYNVHYNDCDQAWVMCRHHQSPLSIKDMAENFGRVPVRMRNFVRVQIAVPQKGDWFGGATYSDLGDTIWYGDVTRILRFWIHEAGHTIDRTIDPARNDDWSKSNEWLNEYNKDGFICDEYAKTNAAENFAQEVIVALFDKVVPGGLGTVSPNWNNIFHQYATVQSKLGDILIPGGTCNRKFADDGIVCMGAAAGCNTKANAKFRIMADKTQDAAVVAASNNPPIEDHFKIE